MTSNINSVAASPAFSHASAKKSGHEEHHSPTPHLDALMKQEEGQSLIPVIDTSLASPFVSCINLLKTIIGAGILALPYALSKFGFLPGMLVMFASAGMAAFGLHLLTVAAMHVGRNASSAALCRITYPKAAIAFETAIAVKCIGAATVYLSIIGLTCASLAKTFLPADSLSPFWAWVLLGRSFWVFVATFLITPVCLMRKMDSLKYTSFAGMVAVFYLVGLTVWNFFRSPDAAFSNMFFVAPPSVEVFSVFGTFIFAYTCHQNLLPIQNEAQDNSPAVMSRIISLSVAVSTACYVLVAVFGYATYGSDIDKVILENFPQTEWPFIVARIFYVLLLLFSYPLQVFPFRISMQKIMSLWNEEHTDLFSRQLYYAVTAIVLVVSSCVAAFTSSVDIVLSLVGSTSGTFLCYFLPALICLKLEQDKPNNYRKIGSYLLIVTGAAVFAVSMVGIYFRITG